MPPELVLRRQGDGSRVPFEDITHEFRSKVTNKQRGLKQQKTPALLRRSASTSRISSLAHKRSSRCANCHEERPSLRPCVARLCLPWQDFVGVGLVAVLISVPTRSYHRCLLLCRGPFSTTSSGNHCLNLRSSRSQTALLSLTMYALASMAACEGFFVVNLPPCYFQAPVGDAVVMGLLQFFK